MVRPALTNGGRAGRPFRSLTRFAMLGLLVLILGEASAEFHVWRDADGRKHVSTIPARGYRADRTLRPGYDPNSIVYQHQRMLGHLHALSEEIEQRAAADGREAIADASATPAVAARRAPREGLMTLDELVALKKRGGRWLGDEATQGSDGERAK
ncbi:MAG: hypothetical protein ACU85U_09670 [Gammaproteobacteria bacterium]|jgi:hypothetical protein